MCAFRFPLVVCVLQHIIMPENHRGSWEEQCELIIEELHDGRVLHPWSKFARGKNEAKVLAYINERIRCHRVAGADGDDDTLRIFKEAKQLFEKRSKIRAGLSSAVPSRKCSPCNEDKQVLSRCHPAGHKPPCKWTAQARQLTGAAMRM